MKLWVRVGERTGCVSGAGGLFDMPATHALIGNCLP